MKRGLIAATTSLFSLGSVSALGFGGYTNFGFGGLFSSLTIETLLEALFFAVLFAVLYWAVGRTPLRDSQITRWIVSFGISVFTLYWIASSGFSFSEILYNLGFSTDLLPTILWMIAILILLFLLIKFRIRKTLAIIFGLGGAFLFVYSIVGDVYNQGAGIAIGVILIFIALYLNKRGPGKAYQYGKSLGRGAGRAGKFLYDHRPSGFFLKREKRIIHKIRKLEKKYQKAMNNDNMKEAKSYADQAEYLKIRLGRLKQEESKVEKENQRRSSYPRGNQDEIKRRRKILERIRKERGF